MLGKQKELERELAEKKKAELAAKKEKEKVNALNVHCTVQAPRQSECPHRDKASVHTETKRVSTLPAKRS